jgi:tetraacyldisaccharide 4'-kinase
VIACALTQARTMLTAWIEKVWWSKQGSLGATLLTPLSWLYGAVISARLALYGRGVFKQSRPDAVVIVVGNIVIGGAGKTPVVQAVVRCLQSAGYTPGVVSRGYPVSPRLPRRVTPRSSPAEVGDEPLLHCALGVPVVVCADRVKACVYLLENNPEVDVIVADDALQHYALQRDIEIEVVSSERGYGNGKLLPAGPLREPRSRARAAALRLMPSWHTPTGGHKDGSHHVVRRKLGEPYALAEPTRKAPFTTFAQSRPAIVAGIANPRQFYDALQRAGVQGELHPFADHHAFRESDFATLSGRTILMTEKDAPKCRAFADHRMWVVPLTVHLAPETKRKLLRLVRDARDRNEQEMPAPHGPKTA